MQRWRNSLAMTWGLSGWDSESIDRTIPTTRLRFLVTSALLDCGAQNQSAATLSTYEPHFPGPYLEVLRTPDFACEIFHKLLFLP